MEECGISHFFPIDQLLDKHFIHSQPSRKSLPQLERKNEEMGQCEYTPMEETKREQMKKEHATPPPSYTIDETSIQSH